jgi:hypothetical protein
MSRLRPYINCLFFLACFTSSEKLHAHRPDPKKIPLTFYTLSSDSSSCILPFNRVGNLMVVKAKVDSMEGNFIVDTGAPGLVLNTTYFRDYPVTVVPGEEQTNITGSTSPLSKTSVGELSFGNLHYYKAEADLVSLGAIENAKGIKVLGLLGVELFKDCEMIIDFEKDLIYLHRIGRKESANYKHALLKDVSSYRSFPIDLSENRIVTTTELEGKKLKLVIDCAAESNLLDSRLPNKIFRHVTITGTIKLAGAGDKKIDALYGSLSHLKLGDEEISSLPVLITNLANTCFSRGGCVDGVLGFDFLSLHKIGFNFVKRKMYIWK